MGENMSQNKFVFSNATRKKSICCFLFGLMLVIGGCLIMVICIKAVLLKVKFHRITLDAHPEFLDSSNNSIFERAERLGEAIKFKTVSVNAKDGDAKSREYYEALFQINDFIENVYPNLHSSPDVEKIKVNDYSMIFRIQGEMSDNKTPYMLCGHLDVAAIYQRNWWDYDPFLGEIRTPSCYSQEQFIYGRGAMDAKNVVFGVLEALEY